MPCYLLIASIIHPLAYALALPTWVIVPLATFSPTSTNLCPHGLNLNNPCCLYTHSNPFIISSIFLYLIKLSYHILLFFLFFAFFPTFTVLFSATLHLLLMRTCVSLDREWERERKHMPKNCSARSRKFSTRTVCITETSRNPVDSKFGCRTFETTQGSISTKCTWELKIHAIRPQWNIKN